MNKHEGPEANPANEASVHAVVTDLSTSTQSSGLPDQLPIYSLSKNPSDNDASQKKSQTKTPLNSTAVREHSLLGGLELGSDDDVPPATTDSESHSNGRHFGDVIVSLENISKTYGLKKAPSSEKSKNLSSNPSWWRRCFGSSKKPDSDDANETNDDVSKAERTREDSVTALQSIYLSRSLEPNSKRAGGIRQGEFVMIRGPSGGGKTTLINIIGLLDSPSSGTLSLGFGRQKNGGNKKLITIDSNSSDSFLSDIRLKHIGYVFQTFNLLSTMTALENVALPMTLLGELNEKQQRNRAKQLLGLLGLRNRVDHLPSELSGGEQQRVTIARALANHPDLMLLDEPTGDLDTATTIEVMDLLMLINRLVGTTMLMVTHNPDLECYADRILYVEDGRFVHEAINAAPYPLILEEYEEYLRAVEDGSHVGPAGGGGGNGLIPSLPA